MPLPQLTDAQRREALKKAIETRKRRAQLKEQVKKGQISFSQALKEPIAAKMRVKGLIEAVPKFGKARTAKLMKEIGINPARRVQGLGVKQRAWLLKELS